MNLKKTIVRLSLLLGAGAIVYGSITYYTDQIRKAMDYCYKIANFQVLQAKKDLIKLRIDLKIENKSNFSLNLKGYDLNVILDNKKVANVKSFQSKILKNQGISTIPILVSFDPRTIFDADYVAVLAMKFAFDKESIFINLKGKFNVEMNFLRVGLPVDLQLSLAELMAPPDDQQAEQKKKKCNL